MPKPFILWHEYAALNAASVSPTQCPVFSFSFPVAVARERDPACESYHDCLLYFKGFQALQTHRVAHWLYNSGRHALAFYLQSQVDTHTPLFV